MVLNGVDVASYQQGINFAKVPGDFAIIKATGGTRYINPVCDAQYQSAKKAGKLLGVYHYAHESYCPGTAEQEAQHFLDNIKGYIGEAVMVLDWESSNKGDVAWAKRWLDYVYAKTGIRPLFYTYTGVLNSYNFSSIANADYGLWVANYGANNPESGYRQPNPPASPYWKSTVMYQYSSMTMLSGWGARLDVNVFYGDKKAWEAYARKGSTSSPNATNPTPSQPAANGSGKNGIAIDNVSKDQATKMVQRIQSKYAWTLLRDQVKAVKQKDGRYCLTIKTGKGSRLNNSVNRLKQELKSYHPGYMQQNIAIVDGDKASARIEARNMSVDFSGHMRGFLKDILLDGQTYAEKNSYGTYDVRVKGEGFNNTDAPIVLNEIKEMGKAKDVKINPTHIKGFKY